MLFVPNGFVDDVDTFEVDALNDRVVGSDNKFVFMVESEVKQNGESEHSTAEFKYDWNGVVGML